MPSSEPRLEPVMSSSTGIMQASTFYVNLLLIAIGGALGSVARYLFSTLVLRASGSLLPLGTFAVNIVGCVMFGCIMGAAQQRIIMPPQTRAFLLIGVLGGFTTFSSYA